MFTLAVPILLLALGIVSLIYPKQLGVAFCRIGKMYWRHLTLGMTDMAFFYREEKVARIFRILGVGMLGTGVLLGSFTVLSYSGPGMFAASRQAIPYLERTYGSADRNWRISTSPAMPDGTVYVDYRWGKRTGRLRGTWIRGRYRFAEVNSTKAGSHQPRNPPEATPNERPPARSSPSARAP